MKYRITISVGLTFDETVEANDELEAEKIAMEIAQTNFLYKNIDEIEFLVDDIEELDDEDDKPSGKSITNK